MIFQILGLKLYFRKETCGWIVWNSNKRFYFWYPFEEIDTKIVQLIINNNYKLDNINLYNKLNSARFSAPLRIYYDITYKCNMSCDYCYNKDNLRTKQPELSISQKKVLIDQMHKLEIYKLSIAGGEPLLSKDLFEITQYAKDNDISVSLTTNGLLICKDNHKKLDLFDSISISLDELGFTDDSTKSCLRRGKGYPYNVIENIVDLPNYIKQKLSLKMVVDINDKNVYSQIDEITKFAHVNNITRIKISFLQDSSINIDEPYLEKYYSLCKYINEYNESCKAVKITCNSSPIQNKFGIPNYIFGYGCGAWKDLMIITPSGKIKPCLMMSETYDIDLENKQSLLDIWNKIIPFGLSEECISCEHYFSCLGGCTNRRMWTNQEVDPLCYKKYKNATPQKVYFNKHSLIYCLTHC